MKHLSRAALCLVAVAMLVLGAASAANAFAPEWGKCTATGGSGGGYTDAACTVKAKKHKGQFTGGYEWTQLQGTVQSTPETVQLAGTWKLETAAGKRIECPIVWISTNIDIQGPSGANVPRWQFLECASDGQECATQFEEEGEINSIEQQVLEQEGKGWRAKLGDVSGKNGPNPVVGMSYTPVERERLLSPIVCAGPIGTVWIGGAAHGPNSVISEIAPVNQMTSSFTETFAQSSPGHSSPASFEGGHKAGLEAFLENHWEPVALSADMSYETEEPLELKATK